MELTYKGYKLFLIDNNFKLEECLRFIYQNKEIAIDTEFKRIEKRKYTEIKLGIIQISIQNPKLVCIIDTLANITLNKIWEIFENNDILKIIHSPKVDIEILHYQKCYIQNIFDVQLGAFITGYSQEPSPSFNTITQTFLNLKVDKEQQKSDWTKRPLTLEQLKYAANDVIYLHKIKNKIFSKAQNLGLETYLRDLFWYQCNKYREIKYYSNKLGDYISEKQRFILKTLLDERYKLAKKRMKHTNNILHDKRLKKLIIQGIEKTKLHDSDLSMQELVSQIFNLADKLKFSTIKYKILYNKTKEEIEALLASDNEYKKIFSILIPKQQIITVLETKKLFAPTKQLKTLLEKYLNNKNIKVEVMSYARKKQNEYKRYDYTKLKVSLDRKYFIYKNKPAFGKKRWLEVLKFHHPGLAPVKDETGWYHIDTNGEAIYKERYKRAFGYYFARAAVIDYENNWFHINKYGEKIYKQNYSWVGNYQEALCSVRDFDGNYFHIDLHGKRIYSENYRYAGDFKDGYAAVRLSNGLFIHIDEQGKPLNDKKFLDLGVYHKNFATAKDQKGWFHIDLQGNALYPQRYAQIEPFYNGYSQVTDFNGNKLIINEAGGIMWKI